MSVSLRVFAVNDTIPHHRFAPFVADDKGKWLSATAIGMGSFAAGTLSRWAMNDRTYPGCIRKNPKTGAVDAAQYMPLALPWAMKVFGARTRSGWSRMAVSQAAGAIAMAGGVWLIKGNGNYLRPDGSDLRSFPSGHAAWAFMGASMASKELGNLSPWYTIGSYAFASGVAVQRVVARRHLPCDVIAGAGIGIVAAQFGYWVGDIIYGNRQLHDRNRRGTDALDFGNRAYLSLKNEAVMPFGKIRAGGATLKCGMALSSGIKGGVPLGDRWGVSMQMSVQSSPLFAECNDIDVFVAPMNSAGVEIAPYYSVPVSARMGLVAELAGGYRCNFSLKSLNRSIDAGAGNAVGRIGLGARWSVSEHIMVEAGVGYEISGYRYSVTPNETYMISSPVTVSGISHSVSVDVSTVMAF